MLTGKAKELLKQYYMENHVNNKDMSYISWHQFQDLDLAFQWGVYLEFADEFGYRIITIYEEFTDYYGGIPVEVKYWHIWINDILVANFKSRKEA